MENIRKNNKANTFSELINAYQAAANINPHSRQAGLLLQDLGRAIAYSVLRRVYNASGDKMAKRLYNDLRGACADLDFIRSEAKHPVYDENGNMIGEKDSDEFNIIIRCDLKDGIDTAQQASLIVWEYVKKRVETGEPVDFSRKITIKTLDRHVLIRDVNSAAVKDVVTTPIQQVYRCVRRYIDRQKAPRDAGAAGYTYIRLSMPDDPDDLYLRLPRHADTGSYTADGIYTPGGVNGDAYMLLCKYAMRVDMPKRQKEVLTLFLRHDMPGVRAVATYIGVAPATVCDMRRRIQRRAEREGITPDGGFPDGFFDDME